MLLYLKYVRHEMFETQFMFVLHVFNGCVGNFCAASGCKFQFDDMDDTVVSLTFRVPIAVMLFLVVDLGLFTSALFSFLTILFHISD